MPNCQVFASRRRVEEQPQVATLIMKLLQVDAKMASDFTLVLRRGGPPLRDPDFSSHRKHLSVLIFGECWNPVNVIINQGLTKIIKMHVCFLGFVMTSIHAIWEPARFLAGVAGASCEFEVGSGETFSRPTEFDVVLHFRMLYHPPSPCCSSAKVSRT
jgi:uncharacterized membrane protein YqaE (UPF0057 family)